MPMVPSPNTPAVFTFPETAQQVRSVSIDDEPWWVAADVCGVLGITNPRDALRKSLDEDEKGVAAIYTPGGEQEVSTVNESGLYSLILRSRKPQAKAFKRWITHEVIPSLRKHGKYEIAQPKALASAAGPLPYREQAEILAILRPVLPEHYATATGKVILARVMGERPELGSAETPLYASTFLAEKGHKPATVAKFQSGFGARVSNRYFKMHGRRPEKIPGPAGSRIDKVVVYSEDDRPLLEEVYAEIADVIAKYESDGQLPLEGDAAA